MGRGIKSNIYFSQKVVTIRDETDFHYVTFIFLNHTFGSKFNFKHCFVQHVKTFASFIWFVSVPLFGSFLSFV